MTPREKLELLRSYRAAGGTGSYASLLKEVKKYDGGGGERNKTFLQPNDPKLPLGYKIPFNTPSTELASSVGGVGDEPAYLIPTFKYGRTVDNPIEEFNTTGEHLGGPFKTWQEAEEFGKLRHQYVEKGQSIPSPIRTWGKEFADGGPKKKLPELQPYIYKEPIAESTKTQPITPKPVATPYKIQPTQQDVGEIKVADDSIELEDNSSKDYWSYKERIKRNVDKSVEGVGKVLDKVVLPSAALVASFSGVTIPSMLGSGYLGNQMSNMEEPYMESVNSASGQITSKFLPLSEPIKRIGGFNDFKTAYNEFKKGNVRSGLLNTATGIGGVYDSRWIPGRYDDVVDKGLELLNLYGDGMDTYKGVKRKIDVSNTKKK